MHAIASYRGLPIDDVESLVDIELPVPQPGPHELLVEVAAVSVNPADVKARASLPESTTPRILGFDAAGTVAAVGTETSRFQIGDGVYYSGDITRPGSNADFQVVDERIVGHIPRGLTAAESAAMPLTTIVSWETLFDRLVLTAHGDGTLLVLGAAGGVGSILLQLAKRLTKLRVIGTASTPESREWAIKMGADDVVDHHGDLEAAVAQIAPGGVDYIFSSHSKGSIERFAAMCKPFAQIVAIDEPEGLDLLPLKPKSIAWHWEFMFTRPMFQTADMVEQGGLLDRAAQLFADGTLVSTATTILDGFTAETLREAHRQVESGKTIGKVVVAR